MKKFCEDEGYDYWKSCKLARVIGKDKYSEIGKKGYIRNGNNRAVKKGHLQTSVA